MRTKTISTKTATKKNVNKKRKKIYINEVAWYYEDDPSDKRKMEGTVALLKDLDWSSLERARKQKDSV
jgi:hypothetical protein